MIKTLPHIAIQVQQKMREDSDLKVKFKSILKELTYIFDEKERLAFVSKKIDSINSKVDPQKITCSKGCSHCCYHEISASKIELSIIKNKLTTEQNEKFNYQSGFLNQDEIEYSKRACPLLNSENECSQYSDRPLICRATLVSTPSDNCIITNKFSVKHEVPDLVALYILAYYNHQETFPMRFLNSID
jgi:Fe-S-cluster containining protein